MSPPARRSRARRREYVQELEQQLRVYELQGSEASAKIQMAARRVAKENKQLREFLNRYGFSDNHIAHFLQSGTFVPLDSDQSRTFRAGDPGVAVQSLEQLLMPRRPVSPYQGFFVSSSRQSCQEPFTTSGSTTSSSVWEPPQLATSSYGYQHRMGMAVMGSAVHPPYPLTTLSSHASTMWQDRVCDGPPSPSIFDSSGQPMATAQATVIGDHPAMTLHCSLPKYSDSTIPHYDFPECTRSQRDGSTMK
ncbi:transposase-like protein [Hirsutella rhossiliensis]